MTDIDEVSKSLGSLQSDMKHVVSTTEKILETQTEVKEKIIIQEQKIKSAHKRLDTITPHVEDYQSMKQRGLGITAAVGAFFGVVGGYILKLFNFFS